MSEMNVTQAIEAAVAMEESVRGIFLSLADRFREMPGAADFFRSLAADEADHARLWAEIRGSLSEARLAEPASPLLAASLAGARDLLDRSPIAGVAAFSDACDLASMMENAELLAVFRVLAIELVPDAKRREFLELQIQGHLNRIDRFVSGLGRCGRMDSFPAAPKG